MIGIICAVSINGVFGLNGNIPFHYPDDLRYFKNTTQGSTVIMGRLTFESLSKPLPKRENIIISSKDLQIPNTKIFPSVKLALKNATKSNVWFIGGKQIYEEGLLYADEIHLTITPDYIKDPNAIKFPWINPIMFELTGYTKISDPPSDKLLCAIYKRTKINPAYQRIIESIK